MLVAYIVFFSAWQDSGVRSKSDYFQCKWSSTNTRLLNEEVMIRELFEFDYRDILTLIATFGRTFRIVTQGKQSMIFYCNCPSQIERSGLMPRCNKSRRKI